MKETRAKTKMKLNGKSLVDTETGEIFQLPASSSMYVDKYKDSFILKYDNYVSITPDAIEYLYKHCEKTDFIKVIRMSSTLQDSFCIVKNGNNHPHNIHSLANFLDLNTNDLYKLIKRLVKKNILAYAVCAPSGHVKKIFMLNPYIARRRTEISNELKLFFRNVTKDGK